MQPQQLALPDRRSHRVRALQRAEGVELAVSFAVFGMPQSHHFLAVHSADLLQQAQDSDGALLGQVQSRGLQLLGESGYAEGRHGASVCGWQEDGLQRAEEEDGGGGDVDFCVCCCGNLEAVGVTGVAVFGAELEVWVL